MENIFYIAGEVGKFALLIGGTILLYKVFSPLYWKSLSAYPKQKRLAGGKRVSWAQYSDMLENGYAFKKSSCCGKQILVCGIDDRALGCSDEICDEYMCAKCQSHTTPRFAKQLST